MKFSATSIIDDIKLPDYKGRHLITAKLRLIIFLSFWMVGFLHSTSIWDDAPWVPLTVSVTFMITGICYQNILRNRSLFVFFLLELSADLVTMTLLIYLTGGTQSDYFTLYLTYTIAAGVFYNARVAMVAAVLSIFYYSLLIASIHYAWILSFEKTQSNLEWLWSIKTEEYGRLFLLIIFLPVCVYAAQISNYFTRLKERALEERNLHLLTLNKISSTIRGVMSPKSVIQQVLWSVIQGMGYDVCILVMFDRHSREMRFYGPDNHLLIHYIERKIGIKLHEMYIPKNVRSTIFSSIRRRKIVFKDDLMVLMSGVKPDLPRDIVEALQEELGFEKFVIMPLFAGRRIMGGLIGISRDKFIDESKISILESFANQAALAIEIAQLVHALKNKNIELERANKIKSEFLAMMSHELRTPLTAIIGFSELLLEEVLGELRDEQKESLREVLKNGEHLLHLINNILDLAKVEAGKIEVVFEPFSLDDLVQDVKASISPLVHKKQQKFEVQVDSNMPILIADQRKIRQILLNLLSNAIKFTPIGGNITLQVHHILKIPQDPLYERAQTLAPCAEGYFELLLQDTGIGIEPKDIDNIFNVFEQVDSSFTRKYQGTGLGLALTKQFVEMHEGRIWVESQAGMGSKFYILLPVIPQAAREIETGAPEESLQNAKNEAL